MSPSKHFVFCRQGQFHLGLLPCAASLAESRLTDLCASQAGHQDKDKMANSLSADFSVIRYRFTKQSERKLLSETLLRDEITQMKGASRVLMHSVQGYTSEKAEAVSYTHLTLPTTRMV